MDIYEKALNKLRADARPLNELERRSGIPAETLRDIKRGIVESPRYSTLKKLSRFYGARA